MKLQVKKIVLLTVGMVVLLFASCVKDEIDDPPATGGDPAITVNTTIAHVKSFFYGPVLRIDSDWVFKAVVIGDDHSGNLYKSVVLQDSTGAISIQLDQSSFYTTYKVGRNVFVKCKGLFLGAYNKLIQLGGYEDAGSVGRIPQSLVGQHLIPGLWNQPYETKVINDINDLDNLLDQNQLVKLTGVHFTAPCQPFADMALERSGDRDLMDAFGHTMVVRTSNFATFGSAMIPDSTGDLTGIFQVYGTTKQFVIRDLNDVVIASSGCPQPSGPTISIAGLRALYTGSTGTIPVNTIIKGVVISDRYNGNITSRNMVIQDSTGGIVVRFTEDNIFYLNDMVLVDVSGQEISEFNSLLQANNVPRTKGYLVSTGAAVTPRIATIADIQANGEAWESTLVKILNVTSLSGGTAGTWEGSVALNDGTGSINHFTRTAATFKGSIYPSSAASITGYINVFNNNYELNMRNLSDIVQ